MSPLRWPPGHRFLGMAGERAEAHARDGYRNVQSDGPGRSVGPDHDIRSARLPVSLQGVTRHGCPQEHQVIERRELPLGPPAPDAVDAGVGCPVDLGDDIAIEGVGLPQAPSVTVGGLHEALSDSSASTSSI